MKPDNSKELCHSVPRIDGKKHRVRLLGSARKHGFTTLRRAVNGLGNRAIDRRTVTGKVLAKWRKDLIQDLGGEVSTQQGAIVDLAVKSKLLLDSIDAWLLTQPSLINSRKKALLPVVRERQQLADGLAKYLTMLGLERRKKEMTLEQYIDSRYGNGREDQDETDSQGE
jgi:hypothetical protein